MKIKSDFVTNSSSTAYIVAVPMDFIPDPKKVIEHFNYYDQDLEEEKTPDSKILTDFNECLDNIKDGEDLWFYGDDGTDYRTFAVMTEICDENNFFLCVFEISGEGNNRIQGIKEEELNKWFMNTQLDKLKIEVDDE